MKTSRVYVSAVLAVLALGACKKPDAEPTPAEMTAPGKPAQPEMKPAEPAAPAGMSITSKVPAAIEAFKAGLELQDNFHFDDAVAQFKKAIELDPDFALAHAYAGNLTPGTEGDTELAKAKSLADKLPANEQLRIEAFMADRKGDNAAGDAAWGKLAKESPGDWRAGLAYGGRLNAERRYDDSVAALETVQKGNPNIPQVWNLLAYANAGKQSWDAAIAAAKKQTELLPKEANPADTYGEILLMGGKFTDAEAAFQKALELDPKFSLAWQGVAFARAYDLSKSPLGNSAAALEALAKGEAAAVRPEDKIGCAYDTAWVQLGSKPADALATLHTIGKNAALAGRQETAFALLEETHMDLLLGKPADAAKALAAGKAIDTKAWNGGQQRGWKRQIAYLTLMQAAYTGKPDGADAAFAAFEADAKLSPDDRALQQRLIVARGYLAWAKGDTKAALAELGKLDVDQPGLRYELYQLQLKTGDKAGAVATGKAILAAPRRDAYVTYVFSKIKIS